MIITWVVVVGGLFGQPPYTFHPEPSAPDCHRRAVHINQTYSYSNRVHAWCVTYIEARRLGFAQEAAQRPGRLP